MGQTIEPSGVPVWEHAGIICTGEVYKSHVKLTFTQGAALPDPTGLFNASLDGGTRRAIDIRKGETIDGTAFRALVEEAIKHNIKNQPGKRPAAIPAKPPPPAPRPKPRQPPISPPPAPR